MTIGLTPIVLTERIARPLRAAVLSGTLLTTGGCSDGRPDEEAARAWFERRYPDAVVTGVRMTEDEVVARSFRFTYRSPAKAQAREVEVQFMEGSSGAWEPRPAEPEQLP